MDDKSALLDQLRIDRTTQPPSSGASRIWIGAVALLIVVGAVSAWYLTRPGLPRVQAVNVQALSTAAAAGSILDASGYVVARRQATVASKITARMVELDIEEGDHVKAGQVIAKLDDTNIRAAFNQSNAQLQYAKAALAETQVNLANAQRDYERQKKLMLGHFVSQSAVDNSQTTYDGLVAQLATQRSNVEVVSEGLKVAQRNMDDTIVRAPFSGIVTVKAAQPGEMVSPVSAGGGFTRTGIGTIVDMDSLEFQVDVNENFINRVRPDQKATAKLNAYPDWEIPAHVIAVIPTADRSKGTVTVRVGLDQKDPRVLPEMGVRVAFLAQSPDEADAKSTPGVSIPANAVQVSGQTGVVYILRGDVVERRAVRLGGSTGNNVTVTSGLSAGDRLAIGDFNQLKDGAKVRVEP
jgi:RND family efflux transporter MFP subunit